MRGTYMYIPKIEVYSKESIYMMYINQLICILCIFLHFIPLLRELAEYECGDKKDMCTPVVFL